MNKGSGLGQRSGKCRLCFRDKQKAKDRGRGSQRLKEGVSIEAGGRDVPGGGPAGGNTATGRDGKPERRAPCQLCSLLTRALGQLLNIPVPRFHHL